MSIYGLIFSEGLHVLLQLKYFSYVSFDYDGHRQYLDMRIYIIRVKTMRGSLNLSKRKLQILVESSFYAARY